MSVYTYDFDVSYRHGAPIPCLLNPQHPADLERFLGPPKRNPIDPRRVAYFIVDTNGCLWVMDAFVADHGDPSRGKLPTPPAGLAFDHPGTPLLSGVIEVVSPGFWSVRSVYYMPNQRALRGFNDAECVLTCFLYWSRIADELTEIEWGGCGPARAGAAREEARKGRNKTLGRMPDAMLIAELERRKKAQEESAESARDIDSVVHRAERELIETIGGRNGT